MKVVICRQVNQLKIKVMKKLLFFLFLFLGLLISNITHAQKISCSNDPNLPDKSWSVLSNPPVGDIADFSQVKFKLIKLEEGSKINDAKKLTESKTGFNDCVLQQLIKNSELIPADFKGKSIIFTGTLFADGGGSKLFKTLTDENGKWECGKCYAEDYIMNNTWQLVLTN